MLQSITSNTATDNTVTDGQKKQVKRFAEDAIDKALKDGSFDKDNFQKLIMRGDEFQTRIIAAINELAVNNQYADEEVESSYGYLSGYEKPKSIAEQMNILQSLFPGIDFSVDESLSEQPLPAHAEGYFVIPRWQSIADTYNEAVKIVLNKIKEARNGKFYNYREGKLGEKYLRQSARSEQFWTRLSEQQSDNNALVVAAQFGLRYRGTSIRRSRVLFGSSEIGLGAFAVGIMLLVHPERLADYDDLYIDCAGDEYAPGADGDFSYAPCFFFDDGRVEFVTRWVDDADSSSGSASGFLPQQET